MSKVVAVKPLKAELKKESNLIGKLNPFVVFKLGNQQWKSSICQAAGNKPQWADYANFELYHDTQLYIEIMNGDSNENEDYIGVASVDILFQGQSNKKWLDLQFKGTIAGKIYIEFLYDDPQNIQKQIDEKSPKYIASQLYLDYYTDDQLDIQKMLEDTYKDIKNVNFTPTTEDIQQYKKMLDFNQDGLIGIDDLEVLCNMYLDGKVDTKSHGQVDYNDQIAKKQNYSMRIRKRLEVARRLFKKFDVDNSGDITEDEVGPLLIETYKRIGIDYQPNTNDIKTWMHLSDKNSDGKVSLEEYEAMVLQSLRDQGIFFD